MNRFSGTSVEGRMCYSHVEGYATSWDVEFIQHPWAAGTSSALSPSAMSPRPDKGGMTEMCARLDVSITTGTLS